jgi:hypothetical protein
MATKKKKEKIQNFINGIQWMFQIQNFSKTIVYKEADDQDEEKLAEIYFNEPYQRIEITIYPMFFTVSEMEQRKIIIHELCHTLTLPLKSLFYFFIDGTQTTTKPQINDLVERTNCQIENIIDALLQGKMKYAKEAYKNYLTPVSVKKKKNEKKGSKKTKK